MQSEENQHKKRSQRDYSYAFKLQVVGEVERGELTKSSAKRNMGYKEMPFKKKWLLISKY